MNITRIATTTASLFLALGLTGCGAIAEEAIEQAIESDTGGDVEVDFDSEDGTFSIEGENGEEFSIDVDEDGGSSVMSSTDEDGNTFEMTTGQGLPDAWPDELPVPAGTVISSTVMADNGQQILSLVVEVSDAKSAHDGYVDQLVSQGFTVGTTSSSEGEGSSYYFTDLTNDTWTAQVSSAFDGQTQMIVSFQAGD